MLVWLGGWCGEASVEGRAGVASFNRRARRAGTGGSRAPWGDPWPRPPVARAGGGRGREGAPVGHFHGGGRRSHHGEGLGGTLAAPCHLIDPWGLRRLGKRERG